MNIKQKFSINTSTNLENTEAALSKTKPTIEMTLQRHKIIIGTLFVLIASYSVYGMFGYFFEIAPLWEKSIYIVFIFLYFAAGYGLIKDTKWSAMAALPSSMVLIIGFPFGTALSAYYFWVLLKLEMAAQNPDSRIAQKVNSFSLVDFEVTAFLCILIPYAALAENTIGGLNFIAASIAVLLSSVGIISKIYKKSNIAWIYIFTMLISISLFFVRNFDAGYGP